MRRVFACAVVLVALVHPAGSASAAGGEPAGGESSGEFVLPPLLDPAPEVLLEIVPRTPAEKLQESSVQSADLCQVLELRDKLAEPKPDDVKAILDYANRYFGILKIFSPKVQLDDPRRRGGKIVPPQELVDAIAAERAAIYAFHTRVQWIQSTIGDKSIDEAEAARRLRYAFTSLAASPFTRADAKLVQGQQDFCSGTPT